jgi:glycosyltransferase involved in cell wall biosynthesis
METVASLLRVSVYRNIELILCDDGSPAWMRQWMRRLPFDVFLFADRNEGLGRNTNKGLRAARGEFILQLQDDWRCHGPPNFIEAALEVFAERPDVGLVRLRPMQSPGAYDRHLTSTGRTVRVYKQGAYQYTGAYAYTDNPHIKRRSFHDRLGLYRENVPMTIMESDFCQRVDECSELRVAEIIGYDVFEHIGAAQSFNPSNRRQALRDRLERNVLARFPLRLYLTWKQRKQRVPGES